MGPVPAIAFCALLLLLLPLPPVTRAVLVSHESRQQLQQIHGQIEAAYNLAHGPNYAEFPPSQRDHPRRCALMLPQQAKMAFLSGIFSKLTGGLAVLVSSPCLGIDSLGNYLGNYLENVACAHRLGVTYMGVAKIYEPRTKDASNVFLDELPVIIAANLSTTPTKSTAFERQTRLLCPCAASCHESDTAAWVSSVGVIRPLLQRALRRVLETSNATVVGRGDLTKLAVGAVLPFLPDVSIHYRCGDNFVGHYGFLPFSTFEKYISRLNTSSHATSSSSSAPRLIYVYAEARNRKVAAKQHLAQKCDLVLRGLFEHLSTLYPRDTVLIRRGDDPYADMARLAFSKMTICSVSTFCLWPALASVSHHVYFPVTPIVARGNWAVRLRQGFHWMKGVGVVLGAAFVGHPAKSLLDALAGKEHKGSALT